MTEKAIREYASAREALERARSIEFEVVDGVVPPGEMAKVLEKGHQLVVGVDHLETCVESTHRSVYAFKLLRARGFGSTADLPNSDAAQRLKEIRDTMQHTGDRLIGHVRPGRRAFRLDQLDPYSLSPREHDLTIGSEQPLRYDELVALMENSYEAAKVIGGRV